MVYQFATQTALYSHIHIHGVSPIAEKRVVKLVNMGPSSQLKNFYQQHKVSM